MSPVERNMIYTAISFFLLSRAIFLRTCVTQAQNVPKKTFKSVDIVENAGLKHVILVDNRRKHVVS